jgi:hypothetical protein
MARFIIEHLPRIPATYDVLPILFSDVKEQLQLPSWTSLIRTTELIDAIGAGMGVELSQSDIAATLFPGDEALLITLSFGVLLAWAEGKIAPLPDDWRCFSLTVKGPPETIPIPVLEAAIGGDLATEIV